MFEECLLFGSTIFGLYWGGQTVTNFLNKMNVCFLKCDVETRRGRLLATRRGLMEKFVLTSEDVGTDGDF